MSTDKMNKHEELFLNYIEKYKYSFFIGVIFLMGLYIRYINLEFETPDYLNKLSVWYSQLGKNAGGFSSLKTQVGDYNSLYQFLICIMTYIPLKPIYSYKLLSILFDLLMAVESAKIVHILTNNTTNKDKALLTFATIFICPIVVMNSALWAQCDSIFTFFILLSVRKIIEKKYTAAFISFGISLGFKLQAIFLLPFLVMIYFAERKFSIINFLFAFVSFYSTAIPSFVFGRNLFSPIREYLFQVNEYESMGMNIINCWALVGGGVQSI